MTAVKQQARADAPHERSFFAFALTFIAAVDDDKPPPLWCGLIEVTDDMDVETASYVRRHAPLFAAIEMDWRERAIADLTACGVPAGRLKEPLPAEVEKVVATRVSENRAVLCALEALTPPSDRPLLKPKWAIVGPLCLNLRRQFPGASSNRIYTTAATILNRGIPTRDRNQGLDDDHVRRADRAFFRRLSCLLGRSRDSREHARDFTANFAFVLCEQIEFVQLIYDEAGTRVEFHGLAGEALAEAVLSKRHALDLLNKAGAVRDQRRAAA